MMELTPQKEAFIKFEANAWFNRNKNVVTTFSGERDSIVALIVEYNLNPSQILEVGCSAGYRLNALKERFPDTKVSGIDPSNKAIEFGRANYHQVSFTEGTVDDLSAYGDLQFDLIIIGFVFYVVDRPVLFKAVSEIDRVLRDKGHLIIIDFYSETTLRNNYHHIENFSAYSFKQNYEQIFISSHMYHLIHKSTINHSTQELDTTADFKDLAAITLLKKDLNATYK